LRPDHTQANERRASAKRIERVNMVSAPFEDSHRGLWKLCVQSLRDFPLGVKPTRDLMRGNYCRGPESNYSNPPRAVPCALGSKKGRFSRTKRKEIKVSKLRRLNKWSLHSCRPMSTRFGRGHN
jgi:hypothetical protein